MPARRKTGQRKRKSASAAATRKTAKSNSPMKKRPLIIGKVYANWCGHCQSLKPEWQRMESDIRQMPRMNHIVFVAIEESEKDKLAKFKAQHAGLEVSGYPTIFSHNGQRYNYYRGSPNAESLKQWVIGGGK